MSRSFKKLSICKNQRTYAKKLANKKVRRTKDIPDNKGYKKVFCSWDICDFSLRYDFESWKRNNYHSEEMTEEELYSMWYRWYKSK
jgi:hypothetical protein